MNIVYLDQDGQKIITTLNQLFEKEVHHADKKVVWARLSCVTYYDEQTDLIDAATDAIEKAIRERNLMNLGIMTGIYNWETIEII